tara:strand:- start:8791 stop:9252 length:462 start_codon:yes stop_codon:yes gene_type:complete
MRLVLLVILSFVVICSAKANEKGCLVEAVYHEARGESFLGQVAVANVILNRVASPKFPPTICKVVHDAKLWKGRIIKNKCAFSYYCDGKLEWQFVDPVALEMSVKISELAIDGLTVRSVMDATHYHATYVSPFWAKNFKLVSQIGQHKFYKPQ